MPRAIGRLHSPTSPTCAVRRTATRRATAPWRRVEPLRSARPSCPRPGFPSGCAGTLRDSRRQAAPAAADRATATSGAAAPGIIGPSAVPWKRINASAAAPRNSRCMIRDSTCGGSSGERIRGAATAAEDRSAGWAPQRARRGRARLGLPQQEPPPQQAAPAPARESCARAPLLTAAAGERGARAPWPPAARWPPARWRSPRPRWETPGEQTGGESWRTRDTREPVPARCARPDWRGAMAGATASRLRAPLVRPGCRVRAATVTWCSLASYRARLFSTSGGVPRVRRPSAGLGVGQFVHKLLQPPILPHELPAAHVILALDAALDAGHLRGQVQVHLAPAVGSLFQLGV